MKASRQTKRRAAHSQAVASALVEQEDLEIIGDSSLETDALELYQHLPAAPHDIILMHFRELPFFDRTVDGEVRNGFTIDYWHYVSDDRLLISGWMIGERLTQLLNDERASSAVKVSLFPRPDVEVAFPALQATCRGILAIVPLSGDTLQLFGLHLWLPPRMPNDADRIWAEHSARLGFLLEHCHGASEALAGLAAQLRPAPEASNRARGHLEQAKGVPGHGGLIVGWAITLPGVKLGLIDSAGQFEVLTNAIRWHRPDIVDAFSLQFGNFAFNAGLLQAWQHPLTLGQRIWLIALNGDECQVLASLTWESAPVEPTSFVRWAFELPTPLDRFFDRLDHQDGAIIQSLIADKLASRAATAQAPEVTTLGQPIRSPRCSIIIPLYARFDFMMNQLLEFSEDEQLKANAEIIYVIDDPRIASDVKRQAWLLYESNRVPFKIVYAGENRGFSGANNLGVSVSRAPFILLLNSDVIPVEGGWLAKMMAAFDKEGRVGIVGARLLYPNGSIQHDGMSFAWHPELNAHINKHPRMGLEPPVARTDPTSRIAVTGACLMMRKAAYREVGGLDETFLIGDFEDSDLCLKVRQAGRSILCVEDINLIHLERQSLAGIGQGHYRDLVVRFNAWQHEKKWGEVLRTLAEEGAT